MLFYNLLLSAKKNLGAFSTEYRYVDRSLLLEASLKGTGEFHICVPSDTKHWREHNITFVVFMSKMYIPNLIIKKLQTTPKWRTFYKITGLHSSGTPISQSLKSLCNECIAYTNSMKAKKLWEFSALID